MSHHQTTASLPNVPPLGVSITVLAGEVPSPAASGQLPEWIKVTPRGPVQTRDGRSYSFSPENLVARFKSDGIDIPADFNHAIPFKGGRGEEADAIGWAKELQARPDGTYARMEWLDKGKAALAARTHRYISPSFHHDANGEATWLHSIALLAAPALSMPALAGALPGGAAPATIPEALGLDPSADDATCLAAIIARQADFVSVGLYADTLAALNAANSTIAELRTSARRERVSALMEDALKARKIMPAQRAQYEALCGTDAGLAHVASLFAVTMPGLQPSGLDGHIPNDGRNDAERPEMLAARAARYRASEAASGRTLNQAEAIRFAHENPTAGR